jgi:hypothetical protein
MRFPTRFCVTSVSSVSDSWFDHVDPTWPACWPQFDFLDFCWLDPQEHPTSYFWLIQPTITIHSFCPAARSGLRRRQSSESPIMPPKIQAKLLLIINTIHPFPLTFLITKNNKRTNIFQQSCTRNQHAQKKYEIESRVLWNFIEKTNEWVESLPQVGNQGWETLTAGWVRVTTTTFDADLVFQAKNLSTPPWTIETLATSTLNHRNHRAAAVGVAVEVKTERKREGTSPSRRR